MRGGAGRALKGANSMRVCHVIESGATGSLQMVLLMAEIQRGMGDEVLIAYSRRPGAPADLRALVNPGIQLAHLRMRPLALHLAAWCWRFALLLRRWNPDVLHFHGSRAVFMGRLVAGRRFARRAFQSPHGFWPMRTNLSGAEHVLYRALERFANTVCPAAYVAAGEFERAVIGREIGAQARVLENAVEEGLEARHGRRSAPRRKVRRVVTCARVAEQKDPALFADICRIVRDERPEIEFVWIGDGDRRQRRMLERAGVLVKGWMAREDALRHVAESCVYLSTSAWEITPVSVLEAMMLKAPVLCRRAEWSETILQDGVTGRLFDDARSGAQALLSMDMAWRREAAEAARTVARERFSQERFAADLARIYRQAQSGA